MKRAVTAAAFLSQAHLVTVVLVEKHVQEAKTVVAENASTSLSKTTVNSVV